MRNFFVVFRNGVPTGINELEFLGFDENGRAVYCIKALDIHNAFKKCLFMGDVSKVKPPLVRAHEVSPNY